MPSSIDLHTHTTASDGTLRPEGLFSKALELHIKVLAITDHDSTEGLSAISGLEASHPEIRIIPGIELSAEGELACHLLGYFIDVSDGALQSALAKLRENRLGRIAAMIEKVKALGMDIDDERVRALAAGGAVGRPHLADAMVEKGYVKTRKEAFERFLKKDGPAYIPGTGPSAEECIRLIKSAKGIPVLAHPSYYTTPELFGRLAQLGLMGVEIYYPEHSSGLIKRYLEVAQDLRLIATGGSDFHGPRTQRSALACVSVPESVVHELDEARRRV